jgi:hypothetical protein
VGKFYFDEECCKSSPKFAAANGMRLKIPALFACQAGCERPLGTGES